MALHQARAQQSPAHPEILALVHDFSIRRTADDNLLFYAVDRIRTTTDHKPRSSIVRLDSIIQPCPLTPRFGRSADELNLSNDDCLERCDKFWINSFHTQHTYQSVY